MLNIAKKTSEIRYNKYSLHIKSNKTFFSILLLDLNKDGSKLYVYEKKSMLFGYIYAFPDVWPATNLLNLKGGPYELILFCK